MIFSDRLSLLLVASAWLGLASAPEHCGIPMLFGSGQTKRSHTQHKEQQKEQPCDCFS